MITIWNRRELTATSDVAEQARVREVLSAAKIDYTVKTVNRTSPSPLSIGSRERMGTLGTDTRAMYRYIIYVSKKDYEQAAHIISDKSR
ncbi:MAG: hypothetical protein IJP17_07970 [Clostridia bacterium]|nr:hypothetical protein [Clostridia bacterium]